MKRTFFSLSLIGVLTIGAMSMPAFIGVFNAKYSPKATSAVGKAKCAVCHVGMSKKLNPYGTDLDVQVGNTKKLTADMLAKVEDKDSDGDGVKNGAEIKAGTLPGDKASK